MRPCRSVLMVGTDPAGPGGISAVVQGYLEGGLFERFPCVYVTTHRQGSRPLKLRTAIRGWLAVAFDLVRLPAPLVHVQMASRASFWRKTLVCLMARARRRPYLLHVHGGEFVEFYEHECSRTAQRVVRSVLAHASLVIALSEEWRRALARICPQAVIEVVPNAVRLPAAPDTSRPAPRRGASGAASTVLFLGDVCRAKGALDLVRAVARIAGHFPQLRLVCAGRGATEQVRALARELGVSERVHCPGWLERERKRAALAEAAVFALPSYAEGMPMALLEAMSWGLPVVASGVGGIPQVIRSEVNGLLIDAGNVEGLAAALARLLADAELRVRLGMAARATIEAQFALEGTLARLGAIYGRFGLTPRGSAAHALDAPCSRPLAQQAAPR
ncbi:MAG: glycosyltransferase family 4 protein [Steroidobacteraceae bacterium]